MPRQAKTTRAGPTAAPPATALDDVLYDQPGHLIRRLLRCTDCGQLYFYEFYEEIDHAGGEDPQYRSYIPVTDEEDAAKLAKMMPFELLTFTPRLQTDFPREAKHPGVCWIGK